jgi:hypothetical protein
MAMPTRTSTTTAFSAVPAKSRPCPGADFFGYKAPDPKTRTLSSDFAFKNQGHVDTWGVNLRAKFDLDDNVAALSSVSDYKNFEKLLFIDVDAGPGQPSWPTMAMSMPRASAGNCA